MQSRTKQLSAYQEAVETLSRQIRMLNSRSRLFIIGDILSFLGIIFFPVFVIGTPKFQDWVAISIKS